MPKAIIDPELKNLLPKLSEAEYGQLEANIKEHGCRDPIIVWEGPHAIVDGYNRHEICQKHRIHFDVIEMPFVNKDAAKLWMLENQFGRRNLTGNQLSHYRGLMYQLQKKNPGNPQCAHNEHIGDSEGSTAEKVAEKFNVSPATIRRDAEFVEAVEKLSSGDMELKQKILAGSMSKKEVIESVNGDPRFKPPPDAGDSWEPPTEEQLEAKKEASSRSGSQALDAKEVEKAIGAAGRLVARFAREQGRLPFSHHVTDGLSNVLDAFKAFAKECQ